MGKLTQHLHSSSGSGNSSSQVQVRVVDGDGGVSLGLAQEQQRQQRTAEKHALELETLVSVLKNTCFQCFYTVGQLSSYTESAS